MATPTNLPSAFSDNTVLTAAALNNVRGAFRILQVVEGALTSAFTNNTNTFADTGLTATITPQSTSSKVLLIVTHAGCLKAAGNATSHHIAQVLRNGSFLYTHDSGGGYTNTSIDLWFGTTSTTYLDSPATTSALTYKTQLRNNFNGAGVAISGNGSRSTIVLMEISA
jgi:hypothetical protein